ncbi:MAG: hypothetical protein ABI251_10635 [Mycobacteriaceae bacterium]
MRARRWITHPGFAATLVVLLFVVLQLLHLSVLARVLALVVGGFTAAAVLTVMLLSPPLPRMHARSLLTERLGWLWRFGVATFVLCLAGVLSTYFAHEFNRQDNTVDPDTRLLTAAWEIGSAAAVLGALIFLVWITVDLARLGPPARQRVVIVALDKLHLPTAGWLARWCAFMTRPWWALVVVAVAVGPSLQLVIDLGE